MSVLSNGVKFGRFYEHQLPRPWDEHRIYQEVLEQVELADEPGIHFAWSVEHHFLEEYSHSSALKVFLANAAARTEDIRLARGIKLMPLSIPRARPNRSPLSTWSLTGVSSGGPAIRLETRTRGLRRRSDPEERRETRRSNRPTIDPYPNYEGEFFEMSPRNVVPKSLQDPHPPLWVVCSNKVVTRPVRAGDDYEGSRLAHHASRGLDGHNGLDESVRTGSTIRRFGAML